MRSFNCSRWGAESFDPDFNEAQFTSGTNPARLRLRVKLDGTRDSAEPFAATPVEEKGIKCER